MKHKNLKYLLDFIAIIGAVLVLVGFLIMIWIEPTILGGKIALSGLIICVVFGTSSQII